METGEIVGGSDEKGEGQPRANEMRGVFVRGRMQQFRVNSEQRMLVLTDSQQEGQIRSSCPSFPQVKTIQELRSARSMTFERTKGRATDGLPRSWEGQRKCQLTKQHQLPGGSAAQLAVRGKQKVGN